MDSVQAKMGGLSLQNKAPDAFQFPPTNIAVPLPTSFKFLFPQNIHITERETTLGLRRKHNSKAPVATLPVETLCIVFLFFISESQSPLEYDRRLTLATSVCSFWRDAALYSPELWTRISFIWECRRMRSLRPPGVTPKTQRSMRVSGSTPEQVGLRLQRSKALPFDLLISIRRDTGADEASLRLFSKLIEPHMHRCRSLDYFERGTIVSDAIFPLRGPFENLRSIQLSAWGAMRDSKVSRLLDLGPNPTLLKVETLKVTLDADEHMSSVLDCVQPSSVKTLELSVDPLAVPWRTMDFLARCENVQAIKLGCGPLTMRVRPLSIHLPELRNAHLTADWVYDRRLTSFTAPNLRHLFLDSNPFVFFGSNHACAFPRLTTLCHVISFDVTDIVVEFLSLHPSLKAIEIIYPPQISHGSEDDTIRVLLRGGPMLCPNLQFIRVRASHPTWDDAQLYSEASSIIRQRPHVEFEWVLCGGNQSIGEVSMAKLKKEFPRRARLVNETVGVAPLDALFAEE